MAPPSKRLKTSSKQPDEITFDLSARQDYLTGFHKRKLARAEHAREAAAKKEREEKVAERRQMREQRKEDLSKHVQEFNQVLRNQNPDLSSEDEEERAGDAAATFEGFKEAEGKEDEADGREDEYVDEDKYTTVTVEAMGESSGDEDVQEAGVKKAEPEKVDEQAAKTTKKRPWTKEKPAGDKKKPKQKKRQFRYESKSERKETRNKQKAKNAKAAKARRER